MPRLISLSAPPVWLCGLPPVVEAEHDGEGAGGQHLLVVVVVQAVSRCQGKAVANLGKKELKTFPLMLEDAVQTKTAPQLLLI